MKIKEGEIHIWLIPLHASIDHACPEILHQDERLTMKNLLLDDLKNRYLISHTALRQILSLYLGQDPKDIFYTTTRFKNTYIDHELGIEFNLSHSRDYALCAIAKDHRVGVDIEYMRDLENQNALAKSILTHAEQAHYISCSQETRHEIFFKYWTLKESFMKAIGEGFFFGPNNVGFSFSDQTPPQIDILPFPEESKEWSVQNFIPAPGYMGAIATKQPIERIEHYKYFPTQQDSAITLAVSARKICGPREMGVTKS